jgi:hypothetical protein
MMSPTGASMLLHGLPKLDRDTVATHRENVAAFWRKIGSTWTPRSFCGSKYYGVVAVPRALR